MDDVLHMKKIKAKQDLFRNSFNIIRMPRLLSDTHCLAIGYQHREHKTKMRPVWSLVLKMVQQLYNMVFAGMFNTRIGQTKQNGEFLVMS